MLTALRVLFFVCFLVLVAGVHVYLYRRLVRDVTSHRWLRRLSWFIPVPFFAMGLLNGARMRMGQEVLLPWLMPLWLGVFLNLFLVVVGFDAFRWVRGKLSRRQDAPLPESPERRLFLARAAAATSALSAGGLTSLGLYRAYTPAEVTEVVVRLPHLPKALEGFTIAHLTDVHIGTVLRERFLDELVEKANGVRADLVAITGDLVDGSTGQLGHIVSRLKNLRARHGTYYVTGNHDYYSGAEAWVAALRGLGITPLRNRRVEVGDAGASFDLLGVDDWRYDYELDAALEGRRPSRASVLLAHQPSNFDEVARREVGLQLSGHTHGGQMFPATFAAQLIWGDRNTGLSRTGAAQLWVSRGCGFVGPSQRGGAPPEIAKVVLLAG